MVQRIGRRPWLLWLVALILAGIFVAQYLLGVHQNQVDSARARAEQQRQSSNLACIQRWANAVTERNDFIALYLQPRNDALNKLTAAVLQNVPAAEVTALRQKYLVAQEAYTQAESTHPPIPTPDFLCATPGSAAPSGSPQSLPPTTTRAATSSPTSTATPSSTPASAARSSSRTVTRAARSSPAGHATSDHASAPVSLPTHLPAPPSTSPPPSPGVLQALLCLLLDCSSTEGTN